MNKHRQETSKIARIFLASRKMSKRSIWGLVLGSSLSIANVVYAQSGQQTALADQLFEQGIELGSKGNIAEACVKFEESRQLAPRPGTLYYLAECYAKSGRRASARAMFLDAADAAALAKDQEGARKARQKADALLPVAKLVLAVKQPVEGLEVTIDGKAIGRSSWSTELPVDAGKHMIRATGPGKEPWENVVMINNDDARVEVEIPVLAAQKNAGLARQKIAALAVAGAGVVSMGIGGVFGIRAIVCKGDKPACSKDDFDTFTTGANAGVFIGGIAIVGATVLWLTAPSKKPTPATSLHFVPVFGAGNAGGVLVGSF